MMQAPSTARGAGAFSCAKDGSDHWNAQRDRCLNGEEKQKSDEKVVQKPSLATIFGVQIVNTY